MITLFPSYDMTFKGKIMILGNLILFISFIATLIFRDISFMLFAVIILLLFYYIYIYNKNIKKQSIENLTMENINYNDDENYYCIKPSKHNPFMNPNIINDNNDFNNNINACNIEDCYIKTEMNKYFKDPVYKDVIDIYENNFSQRQFYTIPSTTIPNDQEGFSKWLYNRPKTCKENNGEQCYNNIM